MGVLEGLRPQAPLAYFEALCAIPHGSGNTRAISDYCVQFAQKHGLKYVQDPHNNVVIYKEASPGYESHPGVILQGHLDMVCEKDPEVTLDMAKDGLELTHDGTFISARGTTLGGDDGIAVAYGLALLADDSIPHPPLEVVFTVDEEIGMLGADAMDMSVLRHRRYLNCDSEDEGILTVSCAGGATARLELPFTREDSRDSGWKLTVEGLLGGHSGAEINAGRANANKILARLLSRLPVRLCSAEGGSKDNAIPRASAALLTGPEDLPALVEKAAEALVLPPQETGLRITCVPASVPRVMSREASQAAISLLEALPNGVQAMSRDIPGLVQTSLNLGILTTEADRMVLTFSVRSSVNSEKEALLETLRGLGRKYGASFSRSGDYPAWEYQKDSPLRDTMIRVYRELYGKEPVVEAIHAGLECGLFSDRLPGLDAVSFGPQMYDIHTSREHLDIASTERTWNYLLAVLAAL